MSSVVIECMPMQAMRILERAEKYPDSSAHRERTISYLDFLSINS